MLLHLLVLAPFAAAILMMATSKEDPKSSSRLAFLFGFTFVALSISLIAAGNQATEAIEWFRIPGAKGPVYYYLYSHGLGAWMVFLSTGLSLVALITGMVYAGAIMMLLVFVISVLNAAKDNKTPMFDGVSIFVILGVLALAGLVGFALVLSPMGFDVTTLRGSVEMTSSNLFNTAQDGPGYFVLFEVLGLLLLSSMGAAVLMAKKRLGTDEAVAEEKEEK